MNKFFASLVLGSAFALSACGGTDEAADATAETDAMATDAATMPAAEDASATDTGAMAGDAPAAEGAEPAAGMQAEGAADTGSTPNEDGPMGRDADGTPGQ